MRQASDLLFGRRLPRPASQGLFERLLRQGSWVDGYKLIKNLEEQDSAYELFFSTLAEHWHQEHRQEVAGSLDSLGLVAQTSDTMVYQYKEGANGGQEIIVHLLCDNGRPACKAAIENSGPALPGSWLSPNYRRCPGCQASAFRFPETLEGPDIYRPFRYRDLYQALDIDHLRLAVGQYPEDENFNRVGQAIVIRAVSLTSINWLKDNYHVWQRRIGAGPNRPETGLILEIIASSIKNYSPPHSHRLRQELVKATLSKQS